jgi:hypothetical protein
MPMALGRPGRDVGAGVDDESVAALDNEEAGGEGEVKRGVGVRDDRIASGEEC